MEDLKLKTEVLGLEFTLKEISGVARGGFGVLEVAQDGRVIAVLPVNVEVFPEVRRVFERKDDPACNWFERIVDTVERSVRSVQASTT